MSDQLDKLEVKTKEPTPLEQCQIDYNNTAFQLGDLEFQYKIGRDVAFKRMDEINQRARALKESQAKEEKSPSQKDEGQPPS